MKKTEEDAEELDRKIGARLRYARKARGMTQAALGDVIGVSFQQIHKYELGKTRISTAALIEVARALDISPLDLLSVETQDRFPGDQSMLHADGADALLRAYKEISSPQLRQIVRELARSLLADDDA